VVIFALHHARVQGSEPRQAGFIGYKNLAVNTGEFVTLVASLIMGNHVHMIPLILIGNIKEAVRRQSVHQEGKHLHDSTDRC